MRARSSPRRPPGPEAGAVMTEYVLLVTLVGVFLITAVTLLGGAVSELFTWIADSLPF